jgi:hypothetical protein
MGMRMGTVLVQRMELQHMQQVFVCNPPHPHPIRSIVLSQVSYVPSTEDYYLPFIFRLDGITTCTKNSYSTSDCSGTATSEQPSLTCHNAGETNSYLYAFAASTADVQSLLPPSGDKYAVATFYGNKNCDSLLAFDAAVTGECVEDTSFSSLYVVYPTEVKYNTSTDCTGPSKNTTYPEQCSVSKSSGSSFTNVSSVVMSTNVNNEVQTGWYLAYGYDNGNCDGMAYGVTAYATGVCLQYSSSTSLKIDCTTSSKHPILFCEFLC